ncbi:hypothetical protein [Aneurinibacillus aneurinilyticus]|uniref:hypothetical protein n=1 Tax=Aneurinibacillus aneurinilyticus TaxID=1391 RepID=UPI0023F25898|nr:hypothetical protein [Aneurinibacillus aneurinilyticus]
MDSEKVAIPREVAEAIERIWLSGYYGNSPTRKRHDVLTNWFYLSEKYYSDYQIIKRYADDNIVNYVKAITDGYTVEQTSEERVREYYGSVYGQGDYGKITREAIRETLNMLDISIEGVNA